MTFRLLVVHGLRGAICETVAIDVFTNQTFDVPSVSWDVLFSDLVLGTSDPVLSKSTSVSEDGFIFLLFETCDPVKFASTHC